ncbi:hypothetical protein GCM10010172_49620 [Paractinoplanes ferrugineus]|uniref:Methyltransferase domain-containing protein n=1 Tax=Paractinoplanes ferrugineus TaxID=113564 RepID=A0A919J6I8_9ACTN|nr:class I SAM-dependent methyltransferase [Actinoplanes ferrugineus]GIE15776.1 hypothetical protein Afe05nite_76160 [Actinoplanes ferrugineus]
MSSSPQVYDLLVDHASTDGVVAAAFADRLRHAGMRLWLPGLSTADATLPGTEVESALPSSRAAVHLVGASVPASEVLAPRPIVVLAPGSPVSPRVVGRSVPDGIVVDFRDGFDVARRWSELAAAMPARSGPPLHHAALKDRTAASYDRIAEKFAARWFDHPPVRPLEMFAGHLPRSARVLDAGCGPGHHAKWFAERGHDVVGVDISQGMLRIARARVPTAAFLRMDIQNLRFPAATFDGIWCAGAAMHVPREEIVAVFRGFRRLIRPGGVVGINMQIDRRSEIVKYDGDVRFFEYYRSHAELTRLAARAGLDVVAVDVGVTNRNTHGLDMLLTWATLVAVRALPRPPGL